jgi:hypothetical protein
VSARSPRRAHRGGAGVDALVDAWCDSSLM